MFLLWLRRLPWCGDQTMHQCPHSPRAGPVLITLLISPLVPSSCQVLCGSMYFFPVVRYSCLLWASVLHALLCPKVYSWCIHGERCTPPPPTPLPSSEQPTCNIWSSLCHARYFRWGMWESLFFLVEGCEVKVKSLSRVWLFATPWTVAYQAPPSMGFFRQEYWSGLPLPSPKESIIKLKIKRSESLLVRTVKELWKCEQSTSVADSKGIRLKEILGKFISTSIYS